MTEPRAVVVYVDVDDTLVRSAGAKRIPIPAVVRHVRELDAAGFALYCWSSGGADYARATARELGLEHCFVAFLPKPNILVDDQAPSEWRRFLHVRPLDVSTGAAEEYRHIAAR